MADHQIDNTTYTLRSCFSNEADTTNLTAIDARINHHYRIVHVGTPGFLSQLQAELIRLLQDEITAHSFNRKTCAT